MITENTALDFERIIRDTDLDGLYSSRQQKVFDYMMQHGLDAVVFEDTEECREPALRYLTGHPSDAVLILTSEKKSFLIPWDENLAEQRGHASHIIPYTAFQRQLLNAVEKILSEIPSAENRTVAIPPSTTFLRYRQYEERLSGWKLDCSEESAHNFVVQCRACKDEYEIACTRKACAMTDAMTQIVFDSTVKGIFKSELDVALFIERYLRECGAEKTSFETLCAGPERSFAIHAFPGFTQNPWGTKGLSLLDYGVCVEGYASDCTITIARGPLSPEQTQLLDLVQKAQDECISLYKPGLPTHDAAQLANDIFASAGKVMPHALGHGTGLEIHEAPAISMRNTTSTFKPGHIVTLEPGLYDPCLGGVRLENDVLITDTGNTVLTNSKIFRI